MTIVAAVPLAFTALLKWHVDRFKSTAEILGLQGDFDDSRRMPVPIFEHALLKRDWMPEFHWVPEDDGEFEKAKEHHHFGSDLRVLLFGRRAPSGRRKEKKRRKKEKEKYG